MESSARNTYGEHGQPGGLVVLQRPRSNSGYVSNSNRSNRTNPKKWIYNEYNTNYGSIKNIHQPSKISNKQRMNNMSKAHAKAMNEYNAASQGFEPLSKKLYPTGILYSQLPSKFNKYASVHKTKQDGPELPPRLYKIPERPNNVMTNPFSRTKYLQNLNNALQNSNNNTRKILEKQKTEFEQELRKLKPTETEKLYALPVVSETHMGGAKKRTRKHNNKKRTKHNIRS